VYPKRIQEKKEELMEDFSVKKRVPIVYVGRVPSFLYVVGLLLREGKEGKGRGGRTRERKGGEVGMGGEG